MFKYWTKIRIYKKNIIYIYNKTLFFNYSSFKCNNFITY